MPVTPLVIIVLAASPSGPAVEVAASPTDEGMREYFAGEFRESFLFLGAGVASIGAGVPLFIDHGDVGRPMSVPLMAVGLIHLVLGIGLMARTPGQVTALSQQLGTEPAAW